MGYRLQELIFDKLFWREGPDDGVAIEHAKVFAGVLHTHAFAHQAASDQDFVAVEVDLAAGADLAGNVPGLVKRLGERIGAFTVRGTPAFDRRPIAQGLVGAQGVVDTAPVLCVMIKLLASFAVCVEVDELADG